MAQSDNCVLNLSQSFLDTIEPEKVIEEWLKKFNESPSDFAFLRAYWRDVVPRIYSPQLNCDCLNLTYDEEKAKKYLLSILEEFICINNPADVFQQLKSLDNPPTLCGKVFKNGEPTYSCRDCGMDITCVLCVDCFKTSAHRDHRYKMSTSGGGGYCDCGDIEAWKEAAFCDRHNQRNYDLDSKSFDRLPKDLVGRAKLILHCVLKYCYQLLTWERANDLPSDLQCKKILSEDSFTTMLFNDEVHTYEQVIQTLHRAIECTQKEAIDYATAIDREGRSIVRCAQFKSCDLARSCIERLTSRHGAKPLKVTVMHTSVVAHQIFAMKLLSWLQGFIGISDSLRYLFSETVMTSSGNENSVLEGVLLCDTQLWKTARTQWHQLMIGGMLMDQECKKTFAQVFTKNYPALMKDFIFDDHDHSLSVTSLSVQIYTVPTLAHKLIAEENVLTTLLRTFLLECEQRLTSEGKLAFERNQSNAHFKRAQYILFDLKYLLNSKPDQWNTQLQKHFLEGFHKMLILLRYMQGMDASVRQVGQHVEFEPEWESAFNLHIRLAPTVTLVLEWCGSNRTVLIKAYRAALKNLEINQGVMKVIGRELANHSASCIDYDVSVQPVSIHLPLSRLVSGLHLLLERYGLSFDSPEFVIKNKPTPEQLIELPLRTYVMIAQVHAGMWRRNGYSLLNQIYFYHTAKCRTEMLDRDILMLQIGAALIESNEFLLHLLNKFGLVTWAREEYETDYLKLEEDCIRQTITLVEEFLGLLITLIGERYTPGIGQITEEERVQKEILQQLCIEPMAHSQLSKALSEDPNHETGMEVIIDKVAVFKKPQGSGKGMYEIKPEFLKDYNPFFYHYTREEQSKAEETQRKRKKLAGEEECCPPPVPPQLTSAFAMMVNILQCDIMLHIMYIVLERSSNLRARSYSETQFQKILHLIGYALHEEQRFNEINDPLFNFTEKAVKKNILLQLEGLVGNQRIEPHKDLLNWVIRKFRYCLRSRDQTGSVAAMETGDAVVEDTKSIEAVQEEKKRRAELAAARRSRIMAQMSAMQKNFIKEYAELFEKTKTESRSYGSAMDLSETPLEELSICLGPKQTSRHIQQQRFTCILCQEDENLSLEGRTIVLAAFVQKSTILSKTRSKLLENPEEYNPLLMPADLFCAPHTSTCSHVMHADCWQKYFDSVVAKERRRPIRFRNHFSFDVEKQEFLCPLCECLSNSVLPLIPPMTPLASSCKEELSYDEWLRGLEFTIHHHFPKYESSFEVNKAESEKLKAVVNARSIEEVVSYLGSSGNAFQHLFTDPPDQTNVQFSDSLIEMIKIFSQATYTIGLGVNPNQENERVPLMMWWSCAYTIHAIECLLRDQGKPLFGELSTRQTDCLNALIQVAAVCSNISSPEVMHKHAIHLLSSCVGSDVASSPLSILEIDVFGLMIKLCFLLPYLFNDKEYRSAAGLAAPSNGMQEQYIMSLAFTIHILQILLTSELPDPINAMDTSDYVVEEPTEEESALIHFLSFVRHHAQIRPDIPMPRSYHLLQFVQQSSVPFLRCCALFYNYLTGVPPPVALTDPMGAEFEPLSMYLSLPSITSLWQSSQVKNLIERWLSHKNIKTIVKSPSVRYPLTVNQLVRLPRDYSELINSVSLFTCPNSDGDDSRTPTMCLVCGEMLCSQSYCCQTELDDTLVGACTYHAHYCGAGVGLFLRVRECKVLLLAGKTKGCFVSPPYLDDYGETDQGLRRGNPLHLCSERYKKLHRLWLSHGVPEEIAHALESNANILSTEWQHL
uniref:E3 ubiquitin-protein ligase n=1 Tax=Hemiscolopendra marginata TaxID=943146 RepID=A0A646QGC2_9MYRI